MTRFPYKLIDLTHALQPDIPTWSGSCGFQRRVKKDYLDFSSTPLFRVDELQMKAGIGTHIDAPQHSFSDGCGIADIPLESLVVSVVVIDVSQQANVDYQVSVEDIRKHERQYGEIPADCLVIANTGWSRYWNDVDRYRNADETGQVHFPTYSPAAAKMLLDRSIAGIGIDTLSPDLGIDEQYPVHELFLGAGKYIIENIANAHLLPAVGAYVAALPIKVADGAEAPVRMVGFVEPLR